MPTRIVPGRSVDWAAMNTAQPAAVLWDMDGTIIDSEPLWIVAEDAMLSRYGVELDAELREQLIGSGLWDAAELFRARGVDLSADEIVAELAGEVQAQLAAGEPAWRPGAVELLAALSEAGVPCALVTMSIRSLADQVAELLPPGTFGAVVAGDEVAHEKPHPDPYLRGAAALGVPIGACLAFEDSPTGLRSAAASGAVAIGLPHLVDLGDAPAHALWTSLEGVDVAAVARAFAEFRGTDPGPRTITEPAVRGALVSDPKGSRA